MARARARYYVKGRVMTFLYGGKRARWDEWSTVRSLEFLGEAIEEAEVCQRHRNGMYAVFYRGKMVGVANMDGRFLLNENLRMRGASEPLRRW